MAAAPTLLSKSSWHGVAVDNLVLAELAPYATDTNVKITGTDIVLSSAETQALAKVLHELTTNAAKSASSPSFLAATPATSAARP